MPMLFDGERNGRSCVRSVATTTSSNSILGRCCAHVFDGERNGRSCVRSVATTTSSNSILGRCCAHAIR